MNVKKYLREQAKKDREAILAESGKSFLEQLLQIVEENKEREKQEKAKKRKNKKD